ncbi:MAG: nidogen-like domain-containing protein [candidate division WOR-3 bacterium]
MLFALTFLPRAGFAQGPDKAGYRWIDSDTVGGPAFNWIDITSTGNLLPLGDDDNQGPFWLGFSLPFYATTRESVFVCSNGWVSFNSTSHQFHHYPIPASREPNNLLAPLWVDLDPSQGGAIYYFADTLSDKFVVSWIGVPIHNTNDSCTFQVVIENSGDILFQYLKVPTGLDSCSVGIENESGTIGLEYFFDGSPLENRPHDSLAVRFYRLKYDVSPLALIKPAISSLVGDSIKPLIIIGNLGTQPATFPITVQINPGYEEGITLAGLNPLQDTVLQFPTWVPQEDSYSIKIFTGLVGDQFPDNDTIYGYTIGSYEGELSYDDGAPDTWFFKLGSPNYDWGGAVKFSLPYDQFQLLEVSIFLSDTQYLAKVCVCPDSNGLPQISNPYFQADSVRGASSNWRVLKTKTVISGERDLWLVAFWPRRATGPKIGEDRSLPIDRRSLFGSPQVGWVAYSDGDLMMRLRITGKIGIKEMQSVTPPIVQIQPNVCRGWLVIKVLGGKGELAGKIRDVTGRVIRQFRLKGCPLKTQWVWDGCDDWGELVRTGAYFIELDGSKPVKVLLIR